MNNSKKAETHFSGIPNSAFISRESSSGSINGETEVSSSSGDVKIIDSQDRTISEHKETGLSVTSDVQINTEIKDEGEFTHDSGGFFPKSEECEDQKSAQDVQIIQEESYSDDFQARFNDGKTPSPSVSHGTLVNAEKKPPVRSQTGLKTGHHSETAAEKSENELTQELVGFFPKSEECEDQNHLQGVKCELDREIINEESCPDNFKARLNIVASPALQVSEQTVITEKEPVVGTQTGPKIVSPSKTSKLLNVSVVLEDLFPSHLRKLGQMHLNTASCSCIYCRGEYTYSTDSKFVSKNCQNKKQFSQIQDSITVLKNGGIRQQGNMKSRSKSESDKVLFRCEDCSLKFEDRSGLNAHLKKLHGVVKFYTCRFCTKRFKLMSSLLAHWKTHKIDKPSRCDQCPKKFWYESALKTHRRVHSKEKPFKCNRCSAKFTQEGSLKVHMRVHKAERPFKCKQCSADFKFKSNLTVHLRVHSGEKPFECKHCPRRFMTSTNLKNHLRIHNQEKPFKCNQCHAKFTQSGGLKLHLRVHSGEKPYKCKLCALRFAQSSTLGSHVKNVHSDAKPFACKLCPAKFKWRTALNTHSRVHDGEKPLKCKQCPVRFKYFSSLHSHIKQRHSNTRPFQCALCPANYKLKSALKVHSRLHMGDKPHK